MTLIRIQNTQISAVNQSNPTGQCVCCVNRLTNNKYNTELLITGADDWLSKSLQLFKSLRPTYVEIDITVNFPNTTFN